MRKFNSVAVIGPFVCDVLDLLGYNCPRSLVLIVRIQKNGPKAEF